MISVFNHEPRKVGIDVQRRINALKIGQKMYQHILCTIMT